MSAGDHLDHFRSTVEGCELVAFVDLEARMVLSVSAAAKQPQERLDKLGALAANLLALPAGDPEQDPPGESAASTQTAIRLSAIETTVFVRSRSEPNEALCVCCSTEVQIEHAVEAARRVLPEIGASA